MPFDVKLSIRGLQHAQAVNARIIATMQPRGAMGEAVRSMTGAAHAHAVANTPHDFGALRAAQRMSVKNLRGRVFIDPGAKHPRSKTPPSEYGRYLHDQGLIPGLRSGIRAFYLYTEQTEGERILREGAAMIQEAWDG